MKRFFASGAVWFAVASVAVAAILLVRALSPGVEARIPEIELAGVHPRVAAAVNAALERVENDLSSAEAWGELGSVLTAHHFRGPADECFANAAQLDHENFRWPYLRGYLAEEVDLAAAVEFYRQALNLNAVYDPLRIRLGRALARLNRLDEAAEQFAAVVKRDPRNAYARLELARVQLARGDAAAAGRHLESASAIPGWNPRPAYEELARLAFSSGDLERALEFSRRVERYPQDAAGGAPDPVLQAVEAQEALSRRSARQADLLAARGDFAGAARLYRLLAQSRPDMSRPLLNLAQVLEMQGKAAEGIAVFREVIARFPEEIAAHYGLAIALERAGDRPGAAAAYRRCLELKPDYAEAHYNLALLLQQAGDHGAAAESFARAVQADPQFAPAHLALGVLLQEAGDRDRSVHHLRAAVRLAPNDPLPRSYLERALAAE
jgi:tetratricopeptide (TPR) repeat protein